MNKDKLSLMLNDYNQLKNCFQSTLLSIKCGLCDQRCATDFVLEKKKPYCKICLKKIKGRRTMAIDSIKSLNLDLEDTVNELKTKHSSNKLTSKMEDQINQRIKQLEALKDELKRQISNLQINENQGRVYEIAQNIFEAEKLIATNSVNQEIWRGLILLQQCGNQFQDVLSKNANLQSIGLKGSRKRFDMLLKRLDWALEKTNKITAIIQQGIQPFCVMHQQAQLKKLKDNKQKVSDLFIQCKMVPFNEICGEIFQNTKTICLSSIVTRRLLNWV